MDPLRDRSSERIEFISGGEQAFFDLSVTGACCRHNQSVAKGSLVNVRINNLAVKAKVCYCTQRTDGFRVGLQFSDLSNEQRKGISETVEGYSRGVPVACSITGVVQE